jgi:hypothetical protein
MINVKKTVADFPELAAQWHPTMNGDLKPSDVTSGSNKKVWWKCEKVNKHIWLAKINHRSDGGGCPFCSNQKVSIDNCLATTHPELAKEWHPTENGDLTPNDITAGSNKPVVWQCKKVKQHEWPARVSNRSNGTGCPFCSGKKVSIDNCLATTHPELAKEWHPTENGDLTPNDITAGSNKPVVWQCKKVKQHEWPARVSNRSNGTGCPFCSGKKVSIDNCLATTHPELAKEWHPTENGDLTPNDITAGSNKPVVWQCKKVKQHKWPAAVYSRVSGSGCPCCTESKGEKKISESLKIMDLPFKREARFKGCKNKNLLPFDFIVKLTNGKGLLIEYQGVQHYEPIKRRKSWANKRAVSELKNTQRRDKIKAEWARKNKIPLLVIPYWEYDNIPRLIEDFMGSIK